MQFPVQSRLGFAAGKRPLTRGVAAADGAYCFFLDRFSRERDGMKMFVTSEMGIASFGIMPWSSGW